MRIDQPSNIEFMMNIKIYAHDKSGIKYRLFLHTLEDPNDIKNQFLDYQDLVEIGDVIREKLPNILKEDFGVDRLLDVELLELPNKMKEDDDEDPFDYEMWVEVEYKDKYAGQVGDIYASWFEDKE